MISIRDFRRKMSNLPNTWEVLERIQIQEKLSDQAIAKLLALSLPRFERLRARKISPPAYGVMKLCLYLRCDFETLMTGKLLKRKKNK
jgi:hypothetical protein